MCTPANPIFIEIGEGAVITFNAVPAYETAARRMNLAEALVVWRQAAPEGVSSR
jgi:hypothetical protein